MMRQITTEAMIASAFVAFFTGFGSAPASACNRMDGCEHDFQREDYEMMHSGRYEEAIRQGQMNVEAFRALTNAERRRQDDGHSALPRSRR